MMCLTMKPILSLCFLTLLINLITGKPLDAGKDAKILSYENTMDENGMYRFSFETSDGTIRQETGTYRKEPGKEDILEVQGFYSYYDDKGVQHEVNYIADDNGYRIVGKKIPIVPYAAQAPVSDVGVRTRIDPSVLGSLVGGGIG